VVGKHLGKYTVGYKQGDGSMALTFGPE